MGDTTVHIAALPERVFAELTKGWEDAVPGEMKVGDQFAKPGESAIFTLTALEPPTRLGISWLYEGMTYIADYTVFPDAGGSLVRLEMDHGNVHNPLGLLFLRWARAEQKARCSPNSSESRGQTRVLTPNVVAASNVRSPSVVPMGQRLMNGAPISS